MRRKNLTQSQQGRVFKTSNLVPGLRSEQEAPDGAAKIDNFLSMSPPQAPREVTNAMDTGPLRPVVQRTLTDEAAARLRDAIRHGSLAPGVRLVERDLAERLGMSRIPIREAIRRLVEEGLVKKEPRRGTFVYAPTPDEIEEISSLRVVLERFAVERVLAHYTPEHQAKLQRIVNAMRRTADQRDFQKLYELDLQFHNTLWEIADHRLLYEVVSSLRSRTNRFLYEAVSATPNFQFDIYIAAHTNLLNVLKSGDMMAAQEEITRHILDSKERILAQAISLSLG